MAPTLHEKGIGYINSELEQVRHPHNLGSYNNTPYGIVLVIAVVSNQVNELQIEVSMDPQAD